MRSLAAEQQALRIQRDQTAPQPGQFQMQLTPGEVRQIAADGVVGSKRLAENLEGMLRDKPKFNFFQAGDSAPAAGDAGESSDQEQLPSEPAAFLPGNEPSSLPLFDRRPRRDSEDPNSRDLNLSQQNRQQALTQGLPSTQTARAAAEMFRPQTSEAPQPAGEPASASEAVPSNPAPAAASAPSTSADDSALASRGSLSFDRSRISTASDALGETRGVTDNQLVLHQDAPEQSDLAVRQELGRQSAAEDESKRRGDSAQSSLDSARGKENQLNAQKEQLEGAKGQQRAFAAGSAAAIERDNQLLDQQTQSINSTQRAGENSLARISQLDSQLENSTRARDQAASDISSSQQSVNQLQSQLSNLQSAPTPKAPGNANSNGQGNQAKQESANAAAAQQQQALSSAQTQLAAAQKQQEDAQKRQQDAQAAIQSSQTAAQAERASLEQSRQALNTQQESRKNTQERTRTHGVAAQEDQDRIKDLTSHGQDLKAQFDEVATARDLASASLRKNRQNQSAARENVQQLRSLQTDLDEPKDSSKPEQVGDKPGRPDVSETSQSSLPTEAGDSPRPQNGNAQVRRSGRDVVVQLNSLNQGSDATSKDNLSSVSKNRGGASEGGDLGEASLAAAAAGSTPKESNSSSSRSLGSGDSGGPGKSQGDGSPGHSGEAPGHNKGKG